MKRIYLTILFLLPIIFIISCEENSISSNKFESEEDESQVISISAQTNVIVGNTNGTVVISASDTASNIYCTIAKKVKSKISESDAKSHLSQIIIAVEKNSADIKIEVDHPKNDDREYETKLDIILPDRFNYVLNLGNGVITVKAAARTLTVNLGNGSVQADVALIDTCFVAVSLGNGNMDLKIPGNTNAKVNATVGNGIINSTGLNFQNQQITSKQFNGTLGNGAGTIVLNLGNGNISMSKK